jgi:hypothetical protein
MMANTSFTDRDNPPSDTLVRERIGREVLPVWESVTAYLAEEYKDFESEMMYYNSQRGWGVRYRNEGKQLCILFPENGAFTALLMLDPAEDQAAGKMINFFNAKIRELLNQPSSLPQGRWLWMRLEDHTDFVGFKHLLEIKSGRK